MSSKRQECPVCFEHWIAPIFMCLNGHNICSKCRRRLDQCPICRSPRPVTRNYLAEELIPDIRYECKHAEKGCPEAHVKEEFDGHVRRCAYGTKKCLVRIGNRQCPWEGCLEQLEFHVKKKHPGKLIIFEEDITLSYDCSIDSYFNDTRLYSWQKNLFWGVDNSSKRCCTIGFYLRAVDERINGQYRMEMTLSSDGGNEKMVYKCDVLGLFDEEQVKHRCMFGGPMLMSFVDPTNNRLALRMDIVKKQQ